MKVSTIPTLDYNNYVFNLVSNPIDLKTHGMKSNQQNEEQVT